MLTRKSLEELEKKVNFDRVVIKKVKKTNNVNTESKNNKINK